MSYSCCRSTIKKNRLVCPGCSQSCLPASRQTMLHQIQFPNNQNLAEGDYAFCSNWDCTIGYFSTSTAVLKSQLRVFQSGQNVMLCHCFGISEPAYRAALAGGTAETIKAFVVQQTKNGLCACEFRNPSGRCCLSSFFKMRKKHDC